MIATKTNQILNVVPTIQIDAAGGEVPAHISDPDHSSTYTSGSAVGDFRISFGAQQTISYVAISGHNAVMGADATVEILNNGVVVDSVTISRNHNLFFSFPIQNFTDLQIKFIVSPVTQRTTVSYIAAGTYVDIPKGEQAGYARSWLKRHTTSKTSSNLLVGPTAVIQKRMALKGNLVITKPTLDFIETTWQDFIDFTYSQPFFIKEIGGKPESSYICYDQKFEVKADPQTRTLVAATMKFSA